MASESDETGPTKPAALLRLGLPWLLELSWLTLDLPAVGLDGSWSVSFFLGLLMLFTVAGLVGSTVLGAFLTGQPWFTRIV